MLLIQITVAITLLIVLVEDLRSRSVHWVWFPVLVVEAVSLRLFSGEKLLSILYMTFINLFFLTVQLLLVTAYLSLRQKQFVRMTNGLLGWGDILFFAAMATYLETIGFVLFYISSLFLILIGWTLWCVFRKVREKTIPLAGLQAALLLLVLVTDWSQLIPMDRMLWFNEMMTSWSSN